MLSVHRDLVLWQFGILQWTYIAHIWDGEAAKICRLTFKKIKLVQI